MIICFDEADDDDEREKNVKYYTRVINVLTNMEMITLWWDMLHVERFSFFKQSAVRVRRNLSLGIEKRRHHQNNALDRDKFQIEE